MSETALLLATRNQIIKHCGYKEHECDIELDETVPCIVGDVYCLVLPGVWRPGPRNNASGGVLDEEFDVSITVILRACKTPRDRRRNMLISNLDGLNVRLRDILSKVGNFSYELMNEANSLLPAGGGTFVEPLRFRGMSRPMMVSGDVFKAASTEMQAGIKRALLLGGARRIQSGVPT